MLALLIASSALHAEERAATRGERLALEGRCAAALPELERERNDAPFDARLPLRLGQCALRLRDYPRAAAALEEALVIDPALAEAQLDLARAKYHLDDLDAADAALRASEDRAGEALWQLYRGMTDLRRGDAESAVVALERAVEIHAAGWHTAENPEPVEPVASYYLGLALEASGRKQRSLVTLRGVADAWSGTEWADQAERAIREARTRRAWITLGAGLEYDDNVVLTGRDTPLPPDISDEDDVRAVWHARGGFDLGSWGDTSAGVHASYRGRAHADGDVRAFDSHFPTASLWIDHALETDTHLRLGYDVGYAWVDTDPFLFTNGGTLGAIHAWSPRQTSALRGGLFLDEYLFSTLDVPGPTGGSCSPPPPFSVCGPPGLDESDARDRDGWGALGGVSHALALPLGLPVPDPTLSAGYTFTLFDAEGREYSRDAHGVSLGLSFLLPLAALPLPLGLDLDARWELRDYRHPSTFPEQDALVPGQTYALRDEPRREYVLGASARLSVPVGESMSLSATYRYRDHRSTADVFDYDQHVVGAQLDVGWARGR